MPAKPRVLIAEDDAGVRDIVRTRLNQAEYDVETARTGREALEVIRSRMPLAVVLDINMPELDGFGVLEILRREDRGAPPTLVLTARQAGEGVRRAIQLGAKDYLTKPFTETQLLSRAGRLFRAGITWV